MVEYGISIRQPWAWAIFNAGKDVENRSWNTEYRGRLWIQAGKVFDYQAPSEIAKGAADSPRGYLLGHVDLVDCVRNHRSAWADRGQFHWLITNPVLLPEPIPFRGLQGLFPVGTLPKRSLDDVPAIPVVKIRPAPRIIPERFADSLTPEFDFG
jgi:hypothetical protein